MRTPRGQVQTTIDALSGWTTPPLAARLAGDQAYRVFDTAAEAVKFLQRAGHCAQKQRRYRGRRRAGVVVIPLAIEPRIIEAMLTAGRLTDSAASDRAQIADECDLILRQWADRWR